MVNQTQLINSSYRALLRASEGFLAPGDVLRIRKALNLAIVACGEKTTITGQSTILHSVSVARIVAGEMNLGTTSVVAAILHDSIDSINLNIEELTREFGKSVAGILEGIRKVNSVETKHSRSQAESFRKLLLSLADDVRVIAIKLVERVDEMRHLESASEDAKLQLASETYFLYAPLAHRLGFYNIKTEMEDLSMKYLEPGQYDHIDCKLRQTTSSRNRLIREFTAPLRDKLDKLNISYTIRSRTKSIHSIWQKMRSQGVEFEEVYDIFAVRIIIDSLPEKEKAECWQAYSIVTDLYQPNPSRLRDWISVPKSNGYESLHTTVVGPRGKWVEVQIRSLRMDEVAEKGLAAHFRYKGLKGEKGGLEVWLSRMKELLESSDNEDAGFIDQVKSGLYADEVFVFTPKGELRQLPAGATVLDFAFEIHTEVGTHCVGAMVNGRNVSFKYVLKNGDNVSILTSKSQKPSSGWLSIVITGKARTRIKQALNEDRVMAAAEGKEVLTRRLKNWKISFSDAVVNRMLTKYNLKTAQDLYVRISTEEIDLLDLKELLLSPEEPAKTPEPQLPGEKEKEKEKEKGNLYSDYLVIENKIEGIDYKLSKCCNPVYGDPVFGFVTITEGIKIHRTACPNAENLISRYPYRILPARWAESKQSPSFMAVIKVSGVEDMSIISKITELMSDYKVTMRGFNYNINDGLFEGVINVSVPNVNILYGLIKKIQSIKGVMRAIRSDQ
jgi:GTP diphosphokinase / guanosine-3',5'-bis(diphosphate) 3'-diphosphatase